MCAILDKDVCHEIVGPRTTDVGRYFRGRLNAGVSKLVIGGQVRRELIENSHVKRWLANAIGSGIVRRFADEVVDRVTAELEGQCKSNDRHIIALARVSGARLLYTRDNALKRDFQNKALLGGSVRGRIYTRDDNRPGVRNSHKLLFKNRRLCEMKQAKF